MSDRQGEHGGLVVVGGLEALGGIVEAGVTQLRGERQDAFVVYGDAGKEHGPSVDLFVSPHKWPEGTCPRGGARITSGTR